jgi:hypothetical protein
MIGDNIKRGAVPFTSSILHLCVFAPLREKLQTKHAVGDGERLQFMAVVFFFFVTCYLF